jgi:uncharacterized membrane protein YgdD (TMEM256/DUF423 family)
MVALAILLVALIAVRALKFEWWWYVIVTVIWLVGIVLISSG